MSTWKLDKHLLREMEREAEVEDKAEAAYLADLELRMAVRTRLHDLGVAPSDVAAWLRAAAKLVEADLKDHRRWVGADHARHTPAPAVGGVILDRSVEAVRTGNHCGTSDTGPRRYAALSLSGLGILTRRKLWPEAMRRVGSLKAHPRAQERFLDAWCRVPMAKVREWVGDDEVFFAGLRVLPAHAREADVLHPHRRIP